MRANESTSKKLQYIYDTVIHEPDEFAWVRDRIYATDWPIHIAPEEGRLLQLLIQLGGYKRIVEVGTHAGYSTLWMAASLPRDGKIYTLERSDSRHKMASETFQTNTNASKIHLLKGSALELLKTIEHDGPFDLLFIDADKLNYANYLDWGEKNIRKGGLIIGDNTFLSGAVYGEATTNRISPTALNAMKTFNQRLGNLEKYHSVMLPTTEGWTMGIKQF